MSDRSTDESVSSAPEELRVYLLGPPRVEMGEAVLSIPRRQVRALLYAVAAAPRPMPRERLCYLFWADRPESKARRSLSGLLTHLRRALPDPDLLLTSGGRVGLDPDRASTDLAAFVRLSDAEGGVEGLRRAADLYRGPFLAGFSLTGSPEFEAWMLEQQRAHERRYLNLLIALIEDCAARRAYDAAIAYARRYLATDELAEEIHRRLIALYAAVGDRSAALRQFERCVAILERELGVRPLPQTRAVYESALEDQGLPMPPAAPDLWSTLPGLVVPLVGREVACRNLKEALANAQAGRGRVVLLSGEPGIGKSRLMEAFAAQSGGQALVLTAAAQSGEQHLPYQPVAAAFRSIPDRRALARAVQPIWLAEAARLLPELRDLCPDLPPPLPAEPDEARTRLHEALCRLVLGLAAGSRPLLLCLDDLHWADSATLDWFVCLARRMGERPVLVLGTYRTEEREAVGDLRHSLLRLGLLSEFRLSGLTVESVLQIVRHLIGPRPGSEALSHRLHRATGGNPFFLLETIRELLGAGQLPDDLTALVEVPLPRTVRQAVEARLRKLKPQTRQVLEAAAILGMAFDFDLVRRTAGRGEMETLDGLDEAVARQLLSEHPSGYRFRHALIRQTLEATLGPVRRHLLHRRAARVLERMDLQAAEGGAAMRIARHFERGGEAMKAVRYYRRAARQAEALFAWQEAEEIQSRLLALLDELDPDRSQPDRLALRGQILTARAHVRFLQGRLEDRDADLAALTRLAEESGDRALRLRALVHRVRYLNLDAEYERAVEVAEEGLALAGLLDREGTASRLLAQIGFARYFLGQPQQALAVLESALAAVGEGGSPAMRGRILHILGYVHFHLGAYVRSLSYQRQAYACHQAVGDQNRVAWDGLDIGALHLEMGDFAAARRYMAEHLALARRIGARPAEAYGLTLLGSWELHRGAYLAAAERFREARSMQRDLRSEHGIVAAELGAGLALYHLGQLDQGRDLLRRAIRRARSIGHRRRLAESLVALGMLEIGAGSFDVARVGLEEAVALARDGQCWESVAAGLSARARVERAQGNLPGALQRAEEAIDVAQRRELRAFDAWARRELGLALLAQGKPHGALEQTGAAVEALPRAHQAWVGSEEVHRAHARVLQALGRADDARAQTQLAEAAIQAKADLIPDPDRRHRYVQVARSRIR
jgi:DNA-binding SARP family transcriptional activator/tetratricopeptide (TPR) repeat protein